MDVKIGEVMTEVTVTEGVGTLAPDDLKKIVTQVLEVIKADAARTSQREHDTRIGDRAFQPGVNK